MTEFARIVPASMPPNGKVAELQLPDGTEILGWRVYDSILRRSRYWRWGEGIVHPETIFEKAGVVEVFPVAWRPYVPVGIEAPPQLVGRREAEVILIRTLLADGFRRNVRGDVQGFKSSWASEWHTDRWLDKDARQHREWNEAYGRRMAKLKWKPEGFDWDNYLTAMRWYVDLKPWEQAALRWRVVGKPWWFIGDRLGEMGERGDSREAARKVYERAIDRIWDLALRDQAQLRRLARHLWDHKGRHP